MQRGGLGLEPCPIARTCVLLGCVGMDAPVTVERKPGALDGRVRSCGRADGRMGGRTHPHIRPRHPIPDSLVLVGKSIHRTHSVMAREQLVLLIILLVCGSSYRWALGYSSPSTTAAMPICAGSGEFLSPCLFPQQLLVSSDILRRPFALSPDPSLRHCMV